LLATHGEHQRCYKGNTEESNLFFMIFVIMRVGSFDLPATLRTTMASFQRNNAGLTWARKFPELGARNET
jgi:hypothetical protein